METKDIVEAIEKGNDALAKSREISESIATRQEKGEKGLDDLRAQSKKWFDDANAAFKSIEDLIAKASKPVFGGKGGEAEDEVQATYRKAFKGFMCGRGGEAEIQAAHTKAYSIGSLPDGGYALPKVIDTNILDLIINLSPMRQLAFVQQIGGVEYHKLVNIHGTASGWVGETAARPATATSQLLDIPIKTFEIYANPQATQTMLDDVFFDGEKWIADEVSTEFARAEGAAFIAGDGTNKPTGLLAGTTPVATADGARAFGTLQYIPTTAAANWATSNPADVFFTALGALKKPYRANAKILLNKSILFDISAFKDPAGRYIYQPIAAPGIPPTIMGMEVFEDENMPSKAANAFSVAVGDFKRGYLIVDRMGMRTIRDPYTNKPYVGFYTTKRVGGQIIDTEAVKLIKFAVS